MFARRETQGVLATATIRDSKVRGCTIDYSASSFSDGPSILLVTDLPASQNPSVICLGMEKLTADGRGCEGTSKQEQNQAEIGRNTASNIPHESRFIASALSRLRRP